MGMAHASRAPVGPKPKVGSKTDVWDWYSSIPGRRTRPGLLSHAANVRVGRPLSLHGYATAALAPAKGCWIADRGREAGAQPADRAAKAADQRCHLHRRPACRAKQEPPRR